MFYVSFTFNDFGTDVIYLYFNNTSLNVILIFETN